MSGNQVLVGQICQELSLADHEAIEVCNRNIELAWIARAEYFCAIRVGRLYRKGFATFDDYCSKRWGLSRAEEPPERNRWSSSTHYAQWKICSLRMG